MKTLKLIFALILIGFYTNVFAQQQSSSVPQAIKYQAVARDSKGDVISNQNVSFRISILQGSETGTVVYQETQAATTNQFGLANLSIGKGNVTNGNFRDVDWSTGSYFVKVEFDPNGGTNYSLVSTSEMLSVPYALYAEKTGFPIKAALQGTNLATPFTNPETGMLVYNTDTAGKDSTRVVPGYYYNAGTPPAPKWVWLGGGSGNKHNEGALPPQTENTNTTYGGLTQDGNGVNGLWGLYTSNPSGADNTGFGDKAFGGNASTNPSGSDNTAVGYQALLANTSASDNTAIGSNAMVNNVYGLYNTAIGSVALQSQSFGTTNYATNNTAVGYAALTANQPTSTSNGVNNTAVGYNTLESNSTGAYNTAVGAPAMPWTTTGSDNTAMGSYALDDNQKGSSNAAFGTYALDGPAIKWSGSFNTALGDSALASNTGSQNLAVGYQAGTSITIGLHNTEVGYKALTTIVSGSSNTAIGYEALFSNTGNANTAVGDSALNANTTGSKNIAVGRNALLVNTNGTQNVSIGNGSLASNASGTANTACGHTALDGNTTGGNNTAVGALALNNSSTGSCNTAVGSEALEAGTCSFATAIGDSALYNNTAYNSTATGFASLVANTSGLANTADGFKADYNVASASSNTAIGCEAIFRVTGDGNTATGDSALYGAFNGGSQDLGVKNTATGYLSLNGITSGSSNVGTGYDALYSNAGGNANTAVGDSALGTNTSGSFNTALGFKANVSSSGLTNATAIGNGSSALASNNMQLGNANVNALYFGTGNNLPTTASAANVFYNSATGEFFRSTSSKRYKKDITDLKINTSLIYKLRPVSYLSKADNTPHFGLIAEEVAQTIPELAEYAKKKDVIKGSTSDSLVPDAVQYNLLSILLLKEMQKHETIIKEQQQIIDNLNAQNKALLGTVDLLKTTQSDTEKEIAELKGTINSMLKAQASIK